MTKKLPCLEKTDGRWQPLIMSPLRKLKERGLGEGPNHELDIIERNAQRILSLVNQILDVRKFDKQQMHLVCREVDLVQFVSGVFKMYEYTARERGITFHFNHKMEKMMVWIDTVNFDKVVSNLLSNAFKDRKSTRLNSSHTS